MGWREELLNGLQAASNAVAGNVSGPVDLINAGLGLLGVPVSQQPFGGSAWMAQRGLTRPVRPGASQVVGETAGLLGPTLAAAYAPQIARGLLAAGDAMPSASAGRAASPNQKGIFAGTEAQTANLKALDAAKGRIARGDDPAKVWAETGWGKGPDGKWRFEISDDVMPVKIDLNKRALEAYPEVGNAFGHEDLFRAYPELAKLRLANTVDDSSLGAYLQSQKVVELKAPAAGASSPDTNRALRSVAAHELQHAVQSAEGFPLGGNPETARRALANATRASSMPLEKPWDELQKTYARLSPLSDEQIYQRLAGEAEARLAQARINFPPWARSMSYPWHPDYFKRATGVPIDELIFYNGLLD